MRSLSAKRRAQLPDEAALKAYLIERHNGVCCWCGAEPGTDKHEISRGANRHRCVLAKCAVLLLGRKCHAVITRMASDDAERLGLAILKRSRPEDYSLIEFNRLINPAAPDRITEREVSDWSRRLEV